MRWCGLDWYGSGYGEVESSCECRTETLGSINWQGTIEWLHNWWLLESCSAPERERERVDLLLAYAKCLIDSLSAGNIFRM
jgi:hypothetical protein